MTRALTVALVALLGQCESDEDAAGIVDGQVSGLAHDLHEVIYQPAGVPTGSVKSVRLRYVQPKLAGEDAVEFAQIEPDFQHLCDSDGIAHLEKSAPNAAEIVISIASEPFEFGETAPEIIQYIDAFDVKDGACVWGGL